MAEQKKKGMSIWGKLGIGCGGLIVLIIIIAVAAGGSSSTKNTAKQAETKKVFTKDEVVTLKDHEIKITGVQENFDSGNSYVKPQKDGNMFVVVGVKIKNISSKDLLFNSFGFKLEDGAGIKRDTTYITGVDNVLETATLSPGAETTGNLSFEAKTDSDKLILYYTGNFSSGGDVTIKLK